MFCLLLYFIYIFAYFYPALSYVFSYLCIIFIFFFTRYFITTVDPFYFLILHLLHLNHNFDALYSFY